MGTYFEIDDNYEIIDTSIDFCTITFFFKIVGGSCYRIVVAA